VRCFWTWRETEARAQARHVQVGLRAVRVGADEEHGATHWKDVEARGVGARAVDGEEARRLLLLAQGDREGALLVDGADEGDGASEARVCVPLPQAPGRDAAVGVHEDALHRKGGRCVCDGVLTSNATKAPR
tara:strand:+ start:6244 stop:6639 length:396 start_codon:yes stop_codon:yes gene_type:complete